MHLTFCRIIDRIIIYGGFCMKEQYYKEFFEKSPTAYSYHRAILDEQGVPYDYEFLEINPIYEKMMNMNAVDVLNKRFYDLFPDGWEGEWQWKEILNDAIMKKKAAHFDMHHYSLQKWFRVTVFPLSHDIFGCIIHDATKEHLLGKEIEGILMVNPDMLCVATTDGMFLKVNQKFVNVLGYSIEELEGENFFKLVHPEDVPSAIEAMKYLEDQHSISSFINRVRCKDGSYKYLEWRSQPNGKYIYASARDITEKRLKEMTLIQLTEELQRKNEALKTLAITDELTGLYNRHYIDKWIEMEMECSDRHHKPISLIIFDLDHFKRVNDKWGHPVGDEVLKHIAELTQTIIRKSDIVARFGGEEFIILLPKCSANDAAHVAEKVRKHIENNPYGTVGTVTASFGVSEKKKFESFYSWYKRTDEALYLAKKGGRNRVVISDTPMNEPIASVHLEWKSEWECGYLEIDEQHKELVEQGDRLIFMSYTKVDYEELMNQLKIVLRLVSDHFEKEEIILKDIHYPDYKSHTAIHKSLVEKALKLKESYKKGELKPSAFFSFIVDDIIIGHMLDVDMEYFPYIKDHFKGYLLPKQEPTEIL